MKQDKPDSSKTLAALKDFQRRTVEYAFKRLYTDPDATRRFLVADEVGLGKTLVARGLIAKAIDHLWENVPRIDVVYICSNGDIARQNITRLRVGRDESFSPPSRLTMLPMHIKGLDSGRRVNFVAFTPGTSFDLKSAGGMATERALLHRALSETWELRGKAPYNVLSLTRGVDRFIDYDCAFMTQTELDEEILATFHKRLDAHDHACKTTGRPAYRLRFEKLCEAFSRSDRRIPDETQRERSALIGELRQEMAFASLERLQPDLIIMDEFQRFKHLLDPSQEGGDLAQHLFSYSDASSAARVVLLSATPYKMFTQYAETDTDKHYEDFIATLKFLLHDEKKTAEVDALLEEYSKALHVVSQPGGTDRLLTAKGKLEAILRRVMVRTERLACSADRNGMLSQVPMTARAPETTDIDHFVAHARIGRTIGSGSMVEYWKSAPYLLNFMDDYKVKDKFRERTGTNTDAELRTSLLQAEHALLPNVVIKRYRKVDPANTRLRSLVRDVIDSGAWRLLWLPPSLPYYQSADEFAQPGLERFTKRLVFSCWNVVPKVIAALVSYEAERLCIGSFDANAKNTSDARKARRPLLRFAESDNRLTGMPVLGVIYPAKALGEACDPLAMAETEKQAGRSLPTLADALTIAKARVESMLASLPVAPAQGNTVDEDWYWAAPLLFDLVADSKGTFQWLEQENLADQWSSTTKDGTDENDSHWASHVDELKEVAARFEKKTLRLGPYPKDLVEVLARMGLSGPGICSYRALRRLWPTHDDQATRTSAGRIAHAFLTLFNLPESMYLIRGAGGGDESAKPYWQQVLRYASAGGLQSTLDEYVHILRESLGHVDAGDAKAMESITGQLVDVLRLRTASVSYDHIAVKARSRIRLKSLPMRVRFALRFGKQLADDGQEITREDQVRAAFNSPFWPFVLATTSIGQEGLDFHQYCHAVVHWNLPTNPVDLEQREGRIHRYKGHAIRKNVAGRFGVPSLGQAADPWEVLFRQARSDRKEDCEITPFWVYPVENGATIERHVPFIPTSRDEQHYERLRKAVSLYRLVFGQLRQEDMLRFLEDRLTPEEQSRLIRELPINLEPMAS